jgi:hypothetical protein
MKPKAEKKQQALVPKTEDRSLKAPQSVIHIDHRISLRQYKYWILMLDDFRDAYKTGREPCAKGLYRFPIERLTEYLGYEPSKEELKTDFEALRKEPIIINLLGKDGKPVQRGMGFISEWEITSKTVAFKLPSFVEEVMRGLDEPRNIFQLLNWDIFNHFSGKYEAVIYKLCRDYVGVRRTPYLTLEEFRKYMGLQPTEYTDFRRLGQWVIYGPCKAINASQDCDINVEPKIERNGCKAVGISFLVEPRDKTLVPFIDAEKPSHPAFLAAKTPILPKLQEKYLALRSAAEIGLCIERANAYGAAQEKAGKPPNYGALYRAAIEEGWHTEQARQQAEAEAALALKKAEAAAKRQAAAEAKAKAAQSEAERLAVLERFRALPADQRDGLLAAFLATDAQARASYKKKGFDAPFFLFPFVHFLKEGSC